MGGARVVTHAILLVGGRGTRLQPLTDTRPKPMLPIAELPFLAHQLAHLRRHGVRHVTFACGFLPRAIIEYFGDGTEVGMQLEYVVEPEPLGTGGAIGFAARALDPQRLLVCNGDVLTNLDIGELVRFHDHAGAVATIALTPVEDPTRYGLVRTADDGAVLGFLEKPSPEEIDTNLINAGTYVLEPEVIGRIPATGACSVEREIFPALVGNGLFAHASDEYWNDIGTFPSYRRANADMLAGRVQGAGAYAAAGSARSVLHERARVSPDAVIHAPVYVGADACVAAGATIGPHTVLARAAEVQEGARAVRSVLLERAQVQREAQVVDSVLGEDATVAERCSVSDGAVLAPGAITDAPILRGDTGG